MRTVVKYTSSKDSRIFHRKVIERGGALKLKKGGSLIKRRALINNKVREHAGKVWRAVTRAGMCRKDGLYYYKVWRAVTHAGMCGQVSRAGVCESTCIVYSL